MDDLGTAIYLLFILCMSSHNTDIQYLCASSGVFFSPVPGTKSRILSALYRLAKLVLITAPTFQDLSFYVFYYKTSKLWLHCNFIRALYIFFSGIYLCKSRSLGIKARWVLYFLGIWLFLFCFGGFFCFVFV